MPRETQTTKENTESSSQPEKAAIPQKVSEYEDNDPVTVLWKSWGTSGMPREKTSYFDRHQFVGGVGRRIPYKDAKKWMQQGHGIHILPVDADEAAFIKVTGHAPMDDATLETMLRVTTPDKIAALLSPDQLDKIAETQKNSR